MNRTELVGLLPGIFQRGLRPSDGEVLERLDANRPAGPHDVEVLSALAAVLDVMVEHPKVRLRPIIELAGAVRP